MELRWMVSWECRTKRTHTPGNFRKKRGQFKRKLHRLQSSIFRGYVSFQGVCYVNHTRYYDTVLHGAGSWPCKSPNTRRVVGGPLLNQLVMIFGTLIGSGQGERHTYTYTIYSYIYILYWYAVCSSTWLFASSGVYDCLALKELYTPNFKIVHHEWKARMTNSWTSNFWLAGESIIENL